MIIVFGLALDDPAFPTAAPPTGNVRYLGPHGLLQVLESHLGLSGHSRNDDYLRLEQYRQALRRLLEDSPGAFYGASFTADQFAAAADLLSRRDELLLAGWDFTPAPGQPPRLACLADIEARLSGLSPGYADRYAAVLRHWTPGRPPLSRVELCEPRDELPAHLRRLFQAFEAAGVPVAVRPLDPALPDNDLGRLQAALLQPEGGAPRPLSGDGSLLILRGKREADLAAFLACLLRHNPGFRPTSLIPDKNRSLDNALVQEGLPGLGIPSASLARPTLQVLKLVTVFLWNPIDPFKVMEFVSLSVKPLDDDLANRIAMQMAQSPGIQGEGWQRTVGAFFAQLDERAAREPGLNPDAIRRQYRFWFERRRYDSHLTAPKDEVTGIFAYLQGWARETFEQSGGKRQSLLVLQEQARRIRDLLQALPEDQLTYLELERIVRTVYEPAPVQVHRQQRGRLPYVYQPHALIGPADDVLWWNFVQREPDYFFSRWYEPERAFLAHQGIALDTPQQENARLIRQRKQPVLLTRRRLVLVIPGYIDGSPVLPHPLLGDLEARFGDLGPVSFDIDRHDGAAAWSDTFTLPALATVSPRRLGRPGPFFLLRDGRQLDRRDEETFSSLQTLFYYPYQWVFRHKLMLRKSSILSIVPDHTLLGNLAHRFFEQLLTQPGVQQWPRSEVEHWIDREAGALLEREGSVLLLYGREPERVSFIRQIKYAAWSLINLIRSNGWTVAATEQPLEGRFLDIPLNGRADLILQRGDEYAVIDLKWRGAAYRQRILRNEEDLQLVLYARLISPDQSWAHAAYFILNRGQLIARNNLAFREINPVTPEADHVEINQRILNRMIATYRWRMNQISQGRIEVRCAHTRDDLEAAYGQELLDLLEMKTEDAPFDDYRTLIYLVE